MDMKNEATAGQTFLEHLGYTVTATPDRTDRHGNAIGYELEGRRGARYILRRQVGNPSLMSLVNARNPFANAPRISGYGWFSDASGVLAPVNVL